MRLTRSEQETIRETIAATDREAKVYLFGSRVDDHAKGGDIDLFVLSDKIDVMAKLDLLAQLHARLGDRRIDLIVDTTASRPFARIAMATGILL